MLMFFYMADRRKTDSLIITFLKFINKCTRLTGWIPPAHIEQILQLTMKAMPSKHLPVQYQTVQVKICSKITIKSPERRHWRLSCLFSANFGHITYLFNGFIAAFEQLNICLVCLNYKEMQYRISCVNFYFKKIGEAL